MDLRNKQSKMN
ncbi:Multifunctional CCA protein, partial [Haemophilus influenzae]